VDGYGQTKWVAEKLVRQAGNRGLPVRIYRPGTISGHSSSGATNAYDLLMAVIVESLQIGRSPDIKGWRAEMTPVDFVSKAILTLADDIDTDRVVFHLGDSQPVYTTAVFESLSQLGYATESLDWDEWVELWNEKRSSAKKGDETFTAQILRGGMPSPDFMRCIPILNDSATKSALGNLPRPAVDAKLLAVYARHWYSRGWVPRPPLSKTVLNGFHTLRKSPLSGKVAVVTGASSGIGAAVAVALAAEGVHVALAARRTEALNSIKARCASVASGNKISIHQTDVTDRHQVESLMLSVRNSLGSIDILVACAGVMYYTLMANAHVDEWDRTVDVNCKGLLHSLASTVPGMVARGTGHIVAISSDAGRKVFPGLGVYSASKFFVEATLQALRVETADTGLRVTSVQPGNTITEILGQSTDQEAVSKFAAPSSAKWLDAEDVARAIVFALKQPEHVAINEIMVEPREEPI
jgi:NADP-dependent 3-hydroxy acid dehydrogenase YdfG